MKGPELAGVIPDLGPTSYRRWRASDIGALTERFQRALILELAGDVNGRALLDLGCGDGALAIKFWERGAHVTGVDASAAMIQAAKERAEKAGANIALDVAAAEYLPFAPKQFDVVTAITILCFVEDAAPVFREIARVLHPGGHLVIGELGKWSSWAAGRRIRASLGSRLWRQGRFRTAKELRDLATQAGLIVQQVRGAIYYPRWDRAARLLSPWDAALGRVTTVGAGFIAVSAVKS